MKTRIAKFIADAGIASRREAEKLILAGRISVNGEKILSPVFFVEESDLVKLDSTIIKPRKKSVVYAFHKPINTMTTLHDPEGRKTIYDALPKELRGLKYIGRLDYKTTGLLLLTNDGEIARKLTLPKSNIPRTYIVTVNKIDMNGIKEASKGITVDGIQYRPMQIKPISDKELEVKITEGKKNEVRIVLKACHMPVLKLHRISFGNIKLGKLPVGKIKKIDEKLIDEMLKTL